MRFQVRAAHSEIGPTLYRIFDTRDGRFVAVFTRDVQAKNAAQIFEQAHVADLFGAESGAWR
jgi:hypothetical protein